MSEQNNPSLMQLPAELIRSIFGNLYENANIYVIAAERFTRSNFDADSPPPSPTTTRVVRSSLSTEILEASRQSRDEALSILRQKGIYLSIKDDDENMFDLSHEALNDYLAGIPEYFAECIHVLHLKMKRLSDYEFLRRLPNLKRFEYDTYDTYRVRRFHAPHVPGSFPHPPLSVYMPRLYRSLRYGQADTRLISAHQTIITGFQIVRAEDAQRDLDNPDIDRIGPNLTLRTNAITVSEANRSGHMIQFDDDAYFPYQDNERTYEIHMSITVSDPNQLVDQSTAGTIQISNPMAQRGMLDRAERPIYRLTYDWDTGKAVKRVWDEDKDNPGVLLSLDGSGEGPSAREGNIDESLHLTVTLGLDFQI